MVLNTSYVPRPVPLISATGFSAVIIPPANSSEPPLFQKKPLSKAEPDAVEQNEKDWTFFGRLCRENRCDFFSLGNTVYIVDTNAAFLNKYAYRLLYYMQPQGEKDITMLSFSTNSIASLFMPAISKQVTVLSTDPDTGELLEKKHDPQTMKDLASSSPLTAAGIWEANGLSYKVGQVEVIPNPPYDGEGETGKAMSTPHGKTNRDEAGKYVARMGANIANTDAQATIPGVPFIVPFMGVLVEGVGTTFRGHYLIRRVTHTLGGGGQGYECQLELFRNGITADPRGSGKKPEGQVEDPKPASSGQGVDPLKVPASDLTTT